MHKVEYKDYVKQIFYKNRGKKHVHMKYNRKAEADKVTNQVLATCWGDSSSDSDKPNESKQGKEISMVVM